MIAKCATFCGLIWKKSLWWLWLFIEVGTTIVNDLNVMDLWIWLQCFQSMLTIAMKSVCESAQPRSQTLRIMETAPWLWWRSTAGWFITLTSETQMSAPAVGLFQPLRIYVKSIFNGMVMTLALIVSLWLNRPQHATQRLLDTVMDQHDKRLLLTK